jgi:hypothetical protein
MANPISALGAVHTVLSLIPVAAGLTAFVRYGRIDPASRVGKIYLGGMVASIFTSFGLSSTGHFNAGHALGILALVVMLVGTFAPRIAILGRAAAYVQTLAMSFSFFLLLVPGTNETLTRLPVGHPIGAGPDSPPVQAALVGLLILFLIGTTYQLLKLYRQAAQTTHRAITSTVG